MKITSGLSKLYEKKLGRTLLYAGFIFLVGYSTGRGYFSEIPKYQQIDSTRPMQCIQTKEIFQPDLKDGKLEKITITEAKKEDEEILKKRNR